MMFNVSSVTILLVLVCLYHVYYITHLCLKMPVWTQCQLNKATSGIFLRSYRMCCNRGKIGKISTEICNFEPGNLKTSENIPLHWSSQFCCLVLPSDWCGSTKSQRPFHFILVYNRVAWHRMWREWVKSLQKNSWSSEEQRKKKEKTKTKTKPSLRSGGFLRKSVW